MKRISLSLVFAVITFFIGASVVFADPSGTANGSSCNSGQGVIYNGQCVPLNSYPSQSVQSAGGGININAIRPYSDGVINVINSIFVPVLFAIAFFYFVYGVYKYFILGADSEGERETGRKFVLWSVIGFAVILSVWGLVAIVLSTFGLGAGGAAPSYPTL